jgi:hypothetical protein
LKMSRIFSTLIPVTRRIRFRRIRSPPQAEDGGSAIKMRRSLVVLDIFDSGYRGFFLKLDLCTTVRLS